MDPSFYLRDTKNFLHLVQCGILHNFLPGQPPPALIPLGDSKAPYETVIIVMTESIIMDAKGYFFIPMIDHIKSWYNEQKSPPSTVIKFVTFSEIDQLKAYQAMVRNASYQKTPLQDIISHELFLQFTTNEFLTLITSSIVGGPVWTQFNETAKLLQPNASIVFITQGSAGTFMRNTLYDIEFYINFLSQQFSSTFVNTFYYQNWTALITLSPRGKILKGAYYTEKRVIDNDILKRHENILHAYDFLSIPDFADQQTAYPLNNTILLERSPANLIPTLTPLYHPTTFKIIDDVLTQCFAARVGLAPNPYAINMLSLHYNGLEAAEAINSFIHYNTAIVSFFNPISTDIPDFATAVTTLPVLSSNPVFVTILETGTIPSQSLATIDDTRTVIYRTPASKVFKAIRELIRTPPKALFSPRLWWNQFKYNFVPVFRFTATLFRSTIDTNYFNKYQSQSVVPTYNYDHITSAKILLLIIPGLSPESDQTPLYSHFIKRIQHQYAKNPDILVAFYDWKLNYTSETNYVVQAGIGNFTLGQKMLRSVVLNLYKDFFEAGVFNPNITIGLTTFIASLAPKLKSDANIVMIGHSMGSYLAAQTLTSYRTYLAGQAQTINAYNPTVPNLGDTFIRTFMNNNYVYPILMGCPQALIKRSEVISNPAYVASFLDTGVITQNLAEIYDFVAWPELNIDQTFNVNWVPNPDSLTIAHGAYFFDTYAYDTVFNTVTLAKDQYDSRTHPQYTLSIWEFPITITGGLAPITGATMASSDWTASPFYAQYGNVLP